MHQRCGSQQSVHWGQGANSAEPPPLIRNLKRDRKNAIGILPLQTHKPPLQHLCFWQIPPARQFYPFANLSGNQHTQKEAGCIDSLVPNYKCAVRSHAFSRLADHISVEQVSFQNATSRSGCGPRSNSSSGPTSGICRRYSFKDALFAPGPSNAFLRIRRCSSSVEIP